MSAHFPDESITPVVLPAFELAALLSQARASATQAYPLKTWPEYVRIFSRKMWMLLRISACPYNLQQVKTLSYTVPQVVFWNSEAPGYEGDLIQFSHEDSPDKAISAWRSDK